jgi:hypothetical protein
MKNYIVTLLLSILVVLVSVTLRRAVAKAATKANAALSPVATLVPNTNILPQIAIGPGPTPCPPDCSSLTKN